MYKISVPVKNSNVKRNGRLELLHELMRFDTKRVFLTIGSYISNESELEQELLDLKDNCQFFKEHDFEVGVWLWSLSFKGKNEFENMRSLNGQRIDNIICPSDKKFLSFVSSYVEKIASCGVDLILFDDDLRFGFLSDSPACLCHNHIDKINSITGLNLNEDEIKEHILSGSKNVVRDAFLDADLPYTDRLTQDERKIIITNLLNLGFFKWKGAVKYAAEQLDCSTASIYRYISEIKKSN